MSTENLLNTVALMINNATEQTLPDVQQSSEPFVEPSGQAIADAVNSIHHTGSILVAMTILGLAGGYLAWTKDRIDDSSQTNNLASHLITGVLATFMVPLFLQMIGSSLLKNLSPLHHQFFVFVGFCSAAAFIANNFASRVSERMMQDAKNQAQGADKKADKALEQSTKNFLENLKTRGGVCFKDGNYDKALMYFDEYLEGAPDDISIYWRKAYILKRRDKVPEAFDLINKAIEKSKEPTALLYYNRACYSCLLNKPTDKIIEDLEDSYKLGGESMFRENIENDLSQDFKSILEDRKFQDYLKGKGISLDAYIDLDDSNANCDDSGAKSFPNDQVSPN